jgi:hypothetical protein
MLEGNSAELLMRPELAAVTGCQMDAKEQADATDAAFRDRAGPEKIVCDL